MGILILANADAIAWTALGIFCIAGVGLLVWTERLTADLTEIKRLNWLIREAYERGDTALALALLDDLRKLG